jgi:hypothetical protein
MKKVILSVVMLFCVASLCWGQENTLLLDDFEGPITGGPEGTVDYGAGNGDVVIVTAGTDQKVSGEQSLKVVYDAVIGGYMWIAKGFGLDAKNTAWLINTENVDWKSYSAIAFSMYGTDSKIQVAFDLKDSGNEIYRFVVTDDFVGWKQVVCPFTGFYARDDWQPDNADKNGVMDFPIKSFQFEVLPEGKGTLYFDKVELLKQ